MSERRAASGGEVEAVLGASRALVGIAARSLTVLPDDVTLPQFRVLVLLAERGPQPIGALADELVLHASTGTRLVDRLARKRLVRRLRPAADADRRHAWVDLTATGTALVEKVTRRRRRDLARVLGSVSARDRRLITVAMARFADAAGTLGDSSWELGWGDGRLDTSSTSSSAHDPELRPGPTEA